MRRCPHPRWKHSYLRDEAKCTLCGEVWSGMQRFQYERRHRAVLRRWWRIYFVSPTALLPLRGPA